MYYVYTYLQFDSKMVIKIKQVEKKKSFIYSIDGEN